MSITVEHILAMALKHDTVLDAFGEALRSDLVLSHPFYRLIATFTDTFFTEYGHRPGRGDYVTWLETLPEAQKTGCQESLGRLQALDLSGYEPGYFVQALFPILQQAAATAVARRLGTLDRITPETLQHLTAQVAAIEARNTSGIVPLADIETWIHPDRPEARRPTGFPLLDRFTGGWGAELWILLAGSGIGKSLLLQNLATSAARRGSRVLHISLEIALKPQIQRYYRQLTLTNSGEYAKDLGVVRSRLEHWFRLAQGEIHLAHFPAYVLTTETLHRTLHTLTRRLGPIDVLVLDYLDLLAPPKLARGRGRHEELEQLTHTIRAYCMEFNLTLLTCSQTVRGAPDDTDLALKHMGDGYGKVRGADGILALQRSPEELELCQARLKLLKVRDSGGTGATVPLYFNTEVGLALQLDTPIAEAMMRRFGHLPTAPVGITS